MEKLAITFLSFALWLTLQQSVAQNHDPLVKTRLMTIRGQWKASYSNRSYRAFEGIPYGQPPIGERRFEPIVTPFKDTVDATKEPNKCLQFDYTTRRVVGVEDCLYLNVYAPPSSIRRSFPVIVWFHEGAYQRGAGTYTRAKYLMDRDVILVTLNYRLGVCGFLSTDDRVVSGNMGLKDQNLALRWVAENIEHFGGDPRRISLFGASAGAASVHYHYLSRSSAGLFASGVSFSGTALSLWAYDPRPMDTARSLAEILGCSTESSSLLVECLKGLSADVLIGGVEEMLRLAGPMTYPPFAPVAERNASEPFVDRSPEEILRSGEVNDAPWTSGVVSDEGASTILNVVANSERLRYFDSRWEELTMRFFFLQRTLPIEKCAAAAREARRHYVGDRPFDKDERTIKALIDMRSHRSFYTILEKATRLQARANKSPVYTYLYSYRAEMSLSDYAMKANFGPTHLDDIFLVLENEQIDPTTTERDRAMLQVMLDFWYSVASTGEPKLSVDLPKVNPNNCAFKYLEIAGPGDYVLRSSNDFGEKKFWSSLGFNLKA